MKEALTGRKNPSWPEERKNHVRKELQKYDYGGKRFPKIEVANATNNSAAEVVKELNRKGDPRIPHLELDLVKVKRDRVERPYKTEYANLMTDDEKAVLRNNEAYDKREEERERMFVEAEEIPDSSSLPNTSFGSQNIDDDEQPNNQESVVNSGVPNALAITTATGISSGLDIV